MCHFSARRSSLPLPANIIDQLAIALFAARTTDINSDDRRLLRCAMNNDRRWRIVRSFRPLDNLEIRYGSFFSLVARN